ncbi:hypothetical protein NL676_007436 [Syzygium grande]|nr:hypothetical protein NL676_007436 [Syzygium grande]
MGIQRTSENFVVDLESLSNIAMKESDKSSWIMTGVTRKSFKRGAEKKTTATANPNAHYHKTDAEKEEEAIISTPERPNMEAGPGGMTTEHSNDARENHQITITTTVSSIVGDGKCTVAGGKRIVRRSGSRRTSLSWVPDPKRILFFFATLSSIGTILLIYFTLFITEPQPDGKSP